MQSLINTDAVLGLLKDALREVVREELGRARPAPAPQGTYTIDDVMGILHISKPKAYQLIEEGMPALKVANKWRIPMARFHEWVDGLSEMPA